MHFFSTIGRKLDKNLDGVATQAQETSVTVRKQGKKALKVIKAQAHDGLLAIARNARSAALSLN